MDDLYLETRYLFGDDRVVIGEVKETKWVKCAECGCDIERDRNLANKRFVCYDCKRAHQKEYDANERRR